MTQNFFEARAMRAGDVQGCIAVINPIITAGGSTAHEDPFDSDSFAAQYLHKPAIANVVIHEGRVAGFQAVFLRDDEGGKTFSIGSFTDRLNPVRGAGAALMAKMKADCKAAGGTSIVAAITSDNTGGLAFYGKMGFVDEDVLRGDLTRQDGTVVDRVIKRYLLS